MAETLATDLVFIYATVVFVKQEAVFRHVSPNLQHLLNFDRYLRISSAKLCILLVLVSLSTNFNSVLFGGGDVVERTLIIDLFPSPLTILEDSLSTIPVIFTSSGLQMQQRLTTI
jgi:hypothetical protein